MTTTQARSYRHRGFNVSFDPSRPETGKWEVERYGVVWSFGSDAACKRAIERAIVEDPTIVARLVDEALKNGVENGEHEFIYKHSAEVVAFDLLDCCAELEHEDPAVITPLVTAWKLKNPQGGSKDAEPHSSDNEVAVRSGEGAGASGDGPSVLRRDGEAVRPEVLDSGNDQAVSRGAEGHTAKVEPGAEPFVPGEKWLVLVEVEFPVLPEDVEDRGGDGAEDYSARAIARLKPELEKINSALKGSYFIVPNAHAPLATRGRA